MKGLALDCRQIVIILSNTSCYINWTELWVCEPLIVVGSWYDLCKFLIWFNAIQTLLTTKGSTMEQFA